MALDLYGTYHLNGVVAPIISRMPKFFSGMFTTTYFSEDEKVYLDRTKAGYPRLTPFVHFMAKGKTVEGNGFSTDVLKPAYVKDLRAHYPHKYQQRMPGEQFGGSMSIEQRMRIAVAADMQDQRDMLDNRLEVMCAEAVLKGTATIVGEGFDTVVDFGRDTSTKIALAGSDKWNTLPATPTKAECLAFLNMVSEQLESWSDAVRDAGGGTPTVCVMDSKPWGYIRKAMTLADATGTWLDRQNKGYERISVDLTPTMAAEMGLSVKGTFGDFTIATYQAEFTDPEDNSLKRVMPDNTVLLVSVPRMQGVRHFGAIMDIDVMRAIESWSSSWVEKDPSVRMLKMESSPLMVPYRPNACLTVTVA